MNENQNQTNLCYGPVPDNTPKAGLNMREPEIVVLITASVLMAAVYSLCFTGVNVYPMLSFFVFCCIAVAALYILLNRIHYLADKRAFRWAIPILILSAFNGIFELGFFSYANVVIIHILFAVMCYAAIQGKELPISEVSGWLSIIRVFFGNIAVPFVLLKSIFKGRRGRVLHVIARVLAGILIALPVLAIITLFLLDADAVFESAVSYIIEAFTAVNINIAGHFICIVIVTIYLCGYIYNLKHMKEINVKTPAKEMDSIIGATFLGLINLLFLFFCVIQMAFLFTGGYMKLPEGIVYSAYAREGFFQLLFVTIINFGVITVMLKFFPACVNRKLFKILLTMLCAFTAILICSSFYRMSMYINVYGYTDIRMMVVTFLSMEMICVLITAAYLLKPNHDFFKRYLYVGLVFYILVNITASQFCVSSLNIKRFNEGAELDVYQFHRNSDTVFLLAEVAQSEVFLERADINEKAYANEVIEDYKNSGDNHWQNWSLLKSIGRGKIRHLK